MNEPRIPPIRRIQPPKQRKPLTRNQKLLIGAGAAVFLILLIMVMMPRQGTLYYGVCREFIELSESYPDRVVYISVDDFVALGGPVKINYKKVDPFGVESINTIECGFKRAANGAPTFEISKVDINGKSRTYNAETAEYIQGFNKGVIAILATPPDLTLPNFSLDNILGYKDIELEPK